MNKLSGAFFALLVSTASTISHADPNLIPNGGFDNSQQLTGWTSLLPSTVSSWSTNDANSVATSGSLKQAGTFFGSKMQSACFYVTPGAGYSFGMKFRDVSLAPGKDMYCRTYGTNDCNDAYELGQIGDQLDGAYSTTWVDYGPKTGTLSNIALSARCVVHAAKGISGGETEFDNVYFNSLQATPVGLESYDVK